MPIATTTPQALHPLVDFLDSQSGPINLRDLTKILRRTEISRADIEPLCEFSANAYRRNLVSESAWYEMLVLCWRHGHSSMAHDHHGSGCAFKIIDGICTETVCALTGEASEGVPLVRPLSTKRYQQNEVCASASEHIHAVYNDNPTPSDLVTIHIYSPPLKMRTFTVDPAYASKLSFPIPAGRRVSSQSI